MCVETLAAMFSSAGAGSAGTAAAGTAAAGTTAGTAAAGAGAASTGAATLSSKLATAALLTSAAAPILFRPSMPKAPGMSQAESPENAAARARRQAQMRARGAYGASATQRTGGGGVAPVTSGSKTLLGA